MSTLRQLQSSMPIILPSLLRCDFGNLEREVRLVEAAGARALHLDVMDGHFVPNITYGALIIKAVRRVTNLPLDVHLMIYQPQQYISQFVDAGASNLTIHAEAVEDPKPVLQQIRQSGAEAGLAINPKTPIDPVLDVAEFCDVVLAMSVEPGFGGQVFDAVALEKLQQLREKLSDDVFLEVDGGINRETIGPCCQAGARMVVVGSSIFKSPDYRESIQSLTALAHAATDFSAGGI